MFKKILVPIDGSEHSMGALEIAAQTAIKFEGQITLIHVVSVISPVIMPEPMVQSPEFAATSYTPVLLPSQMSEATEAPKKIGEQLLLQAKEKLASKQLNADLLLKEGNVVQEITKAAKDGNFDLIIIGIRGLSRFKEIIMGSVSDGVIKQAPCPILIVK